jgi:hypothetical protein
MGRLIHAARGSGPDDSGPEDTRGMLLVYLAMHGKLRLPVVLCASVVLVLTFLGGMYTYRILFRPPGHLHSVIRRQAILSQASQVRPGGIVIFGDSITEFAYVDIICGFQVFNAGLGGSILEDVIDLAEPVLEQTKPSAVIISVGVNDAESARTRNIEGWLRSYDSLLKRLAKYRVFVMAVDPVELEKPLAHGYFDLSFIDRENQGLSALAKKDDVIYVPPTAVVTGLTKDGVHPNAAGYRVYKSRIESAFGCSSTS